MSVTCYGGGSGTWPKPMKRENWRSPAKGLRLTGPYPLLKYLVRVGLVGAIEDSIKMIEGGIE